MRPWKATFATIGMWAFKITFCDSQKKHFGDLQAVDLEWSMMSIGDSNKTPLWLEWIRG